LRLRNRSSVKPRNSKSKPKRIPLGMQPVGYGSSKTNSESRRLKMNLQPRTVVLSKDNGDSAIETFLRSMKEIKNDEDVTLTVTVSGKEYTVIITPKEVKPH